MKAGRKSGESENVAEENKKEKHFRISGRKVL